MSDGGGAYIEAWISRMRTQRELSARDLAEADRMRREENDQEMKGRFLVLALAVLALLYQVIL